MTALTTTLHLPGFFSSDTALVEGEAHHHLFKVKRLQAGERLRVIDGEGHARWAEITGIDKRAARLGARRRGAGQRTGARGRDLRRGAEARSRAWLVEKVTELGVVAIHFISTEREARSVEGSQLARLRRIAVSAVEQSGRSLVPALTIAGGLRETIAGARAAGQTIAVLDASGSTACPIAAAAGHIGLLVGPEGGWSPEECDLFRDRQVPPWSLGPTVLRVETAAVVAAGLVLCGGGLSR